MFDRTPIESGFAVYTRDDHRVGAVEKVGPNYLEMPTGFLGLGHALFIPFDAVARVDSAERRVYLNVAKDALPTDRWRDPPARAPAAGAAGIGTTPSAAAGEAPARGWVQSEDLRGRALYTWDHHKLGDIAEVASGYVDVPTGIVDLGPHLYVPFDAISYCTPEGCFVNASLDQIKANNWDVVPTGPVATAGALPPVRTAPPTGDVRPATGVSPARDDQPVADVAAAGPAPTSVPPAPAPVDAADARPLRVPLYEEELEARKHRERVGEVVVQRRVETQPETITVPVERQEVVVERRPVDRPVPPGAEPFAEGQTEIRVPVYEEKVEVEKRPRVREEVVVEPRGVTEQQQVAGTVRRETVQVDTRGDVGRVRQEGRTAGAAATPTGFRPWAEVMPTYRQEWQARYPTGELTWQEVEPAYQFGYTNYYDPAYQDLTWEQAEPRLRQDWEARHPDTSWDRVRTFVHGEWDKLRGES